MPLHKSVCDWCAVLCMVSVRMFESVKNHVHTSVDSGSIDTECVLNSNMLVRFRHLYVVVELAYIHT